MFELPGGIEEIPPEKEISPDLLNTLPRAVVPS
jgi:hypothetical protein